MRSIIISRQTADLHWDMSIQLLEKPNGQSRRFCVCLLRVPGGFACRLAACGERGRSKSHSFTHFNMLNIFLQTPRGSRRRCANAAMLDPVDDIEIVSTTVTAALIDDANDHGATTTIDNNNNDNEIETRRSGGARRRSSSSCAAFGKSRPQLDSSNITTNNNNDNRQSSSLRPTQSLACGRVPNVAAAVAAAERKLSRLHLHDLSSTLVNTRKSVGDLMSSRQHFAVKPQIVAIICTRRRRCRLN